MRPTIQLEAEAQEFIKLSADMPPISQIGPQALRQLFDELQSSPVAKLEVEIADRMIPGGPSGNVSLRILRPPRSSGTLPALVFLHGGGWVVGNAHTHDRLVRELAVRTPAAVVFVNYSLSPEVKYPTALEECYAAVKWVAEHGREAGLDSTRIAVGGDSAGGNLSAAVTLVAKERGEPRILQQVLLYPVTDAGFDTESYHQFAEGYTLTRDGMMWFWDQYAVEPTHRAQITASPLRATIEQLQGLPSALVITAEADVLRDEGEAYANKLRGAGVRVAAVRFQGVLHGFLTPPMMADTPSTRGAIDLTVEWLRRGFDAA